MEIILRHEARASNSIRYFTGKRCRRSGHVAPRTTSNGKCVACAKDDSLKFIRADPERNRNRVKQWQKANSQRHAAKTTASFRRKRYNLSAEDLNQMLKKQKNACAICKEPFSKTPHVDHCHTNEVVRGLLCGLCNLGLGLFRDNVQSLKSAIRYLNNQPTHLLSSARYAASGSTSA